MKQLYCLTCAVCWILATPLAAFSSQLVPTPLLAQPLYKIELTAEFHIFPVRLNVDSRNVIPSIPVRGREDKLRAIDLGNWLLPYDAVIQALNLSSFVLPNGQIELQALGLTVSIDPRKLQKDPELGLVFSIQDLQTIFGVKAEFDPDEYAIVLKPPTPKLPSQVTLSAEPDIQLEGLPRIPAPDRTLTTIEQRVNLSGSNTEPSSYGGDLTAVGTVLGGSWFVRVKQTDLENRMHWELAEARFQRQTPQADYIFGSQPSFWHSQAEGEFWGFTTIQRQGFKPPTRVDSEPDPRLRLQAAQIGHTISGRAEPGTLVRLTQESSDRVIADVLVDSSGIYRFENVVGSNYRVRLYPEGQLTAQPKIQDVTLNTVPGQLPTGASALVVSGGFERKLSDEYQNSFQAFDFSAFRGGVAYRWGVSENLTVGIGSIHDESLKALAQVFFQPLNLPLQIAFSTLTGDSWDFNADISFSPSPRFSASWKSDRLSSRFHLDWQIFPGLTIQGMYDTQKDVAIGGEFVSKGSNASTLLKATVDADSHFRWNLAQRLGRLELKQEGNEIRTLTELNYNFSPTSSFKSGHKLVFNYETRNEETDEEDTKSRDLATVGWRYRSPQQALDRNYRWQVELGYGVGSHASGIIASVQTTILPGLLLEARFQQVSVTSDEATFRIELSPSFNLQNGMRSGDRRASDFRTQGGLSIKCFFDRNKNGKRDSNEAFHTDPKFVLVNDKPIQSFGSEVRDHRILVRLSPDTYRLDFDSSQLPTNWQVAENAYAVDVVAGSYTTVLVPLVSQ